MNIEEFRDFCLRFNQVTEEFPFDNSTLVFKVLGKMFALCDVDEFNSINLKCDPEKALQLREEFPGIVIPGYHMNKKHWNTVQMGKNIPYELIRTWIADSYNLVVLNLPKRDREKLNE